jgi:glycerol uptake facilitator-like aquaporin
LAGAIIATFLSRAIYDCGESPYEAKQDFFILMKSFIGEIIGTFSFVFFVFLVTNPETTFIQEESWVHLFIGICLYVSRT